jgi:SAM-dependent methyltransferase
MRDGPLNLLISKLYGYLLMLPISNNSKELHRFNLHLASTQDDVDKLNKKFYGRFNFPWYPSSLSKYREQSFWINALNQDVGSWNHSRISNDAKIWVAGCGTNQAVITALKYPHSQILGTDISTESLAAARQLAEQLGVENLTLEDKSLNHTSYEDEFDLIICTGVIHHNMDPSIPLKGLRKALKKNGVLELFVYNYYDRITTTAFQKAIRMMCQNSPENSNGNVIDQELSLTSAIIKNSVESCSTLMAGFLDNYKNTHEADLADALLQPVEHSYTVESFNDLVETCDLEILANCINQWDKARNNLSWNLKFQDKELAEQYEQLPDLTRWKICNLLKLEESPHVWFYVQRTDSDYTVKSEKQICQTFLDTTFKKSSAEFDLYIKSNDNHFVCTEKSMSFPQPESPTDNLAKTIFDCIDGEATIENILDALNIRLGFNELNDLRLRLTSSAYPYLSAVSINK